MAHWMDRIEITFMRGVQEFFAAHVRSVLIHYWADVMFKPQLDSFCSKGLHQIVPLFLKHQGIHGYDPKAVEVRRLGCSSTRLGAWCSTDNIVVSRCTGWSGNGGILWRPRSTWSAKHRPCPGQRQVQIHRGERRLAKSFPS